MRNLVTAAAAALALTMSLAAPALADQYNGPRGTGPGYVPPTQGQPYDSGYGGTGRGGPGYDGGRGGQYDFGRDEGRFDGWERGWDRRGESEWRDHRTLNYWQLVRRIEFQGYYGVRGLRPARWGFGWRAFAYTGRGRPVMIRVNPYNGRVLDVRRLGYAGGFGY
jgi:hypothetical protein